jgi:hypothetical protein
MPFKSYVQNQKIGKPNNLRKSLGTIKPKGLHRIAKIS